MSQSLRLQNIFLKQKNYTQHDSAWLTPFYGRVQGLFRCISSHFRLGISGLEGAMGPPFWGCQVQPMHCLTMKAGGPCGSQKSSTQKHFDHLNQYVEIYVEIYVAIVRLNKNQTEHEQVIYKLLKVNIVIICLQCPCMEVAVLFSMHLLRRMHRSTGAPLYWSNLTTLWLEAGVWACHPDSRMASISKLRWCQQLLK